MARVRPADWLLSGHDFRIVHDLADASRAEKTRVLCDWEVARRNVRVCWSGADLSTNCGVCSKCVWQMLCLLANGIEDYGAFAEPLTTERVAAMSVPSSVHVGICRRASNSRRETATAIGRSLSHCVRCWPPRRFSNPTHVIRTLPARTSQVPQPLAPLFPIVARSV